MNKFVILCLAAFSLTACDQASVQPALKDAPLVGAWIGGPFTLTDQNGRKRNYDEFNGKFRIVYFGYTSCPDICTPDMQQLMAGLIQFEKAHPALAGKVQPLFISFDAEHDTPDKLKQFVSAFHPRLIGLTGSKVEIAGVAKSFAIEYNEAKESTSEQPIFSHKPTPFLMGTDGKPLAFLPFDEAGTDANEGDPKLVAAELAKWVR